MLQIYQRGGNVAKSKFDFSLLTPIDEKKSSFEENLQPIEDESLEDEGEYLDNLPEPEGFWKKLPRNILIGLTHAGRNLHNLPHDIAQGFESGTKDIGATLNQLKGPRIKQTPISESLPYDANEYGDVFGQEGDPTLLDSLIQGGIEHAPEIMGAGGIIRAGLRKYPITSRGAGRRLRKADRFATERNISPIPPGFETIEESIPFLPKTHATRELLKKAEQGDYNSLFSLQSQIGKHERDLRSSSLASERLLAPQAQDLKRKILNDLETGLRAHGHNDIADLMREGINDYRKYIKFREDVKPIIKKIGIPTSALAFVGLLSTKGKKLASKFMD